MIRSTFALIALACAAARAFAEDCAPLKQIASLETQPLGNSSVMTADAGFNGTPKPMIVDTGAGISMIREGALEPLGLHGIRNSNIVMLGGAGAASQSFTEVTDFTVGTIRVPRAQFQVAPNSSGEAPFVGWLGGDLLSLYDVEIDPAGHRLNFFAKDHCPGHVLYWHPTGLAVLPIQTQLATGDASRTGFRSYVYRARSIYVPVNLAGKDMQAQIDTGASASTISAKTAAALFDVTADSPGSTGQESVDGDPKHIRFIHTFPTLTFDGVTVTNARFVVYPDLIGAHDPNNTSRTDTRVAKIDDNLTAANHISIGMDVLRRLRLFVAFSESKLYVTPATAPLTPVTAAPATSLRPLAIGK